MEGELSALQSAYNLLLGCVNLGTGDLSLVDGLSLSSSRKIHHKREDYPFVSIWSAAEWKAHPKNKINRQGGAASFHQEQQKDEGTQDSLYYIQDESGNSISECDAADLCYQARKIWEYLLQKEMAPRQWTQCTGPAREYYLQEIYKFCPDLMHCDGDWKAERLAIDNYGNWTRNRVKESDVQVKAEETPVKQEAIVKVEGTKHKEVLSTKTPTKPEKVPRLTSPNTTHSLAPSGTIHIDLNNDVFTPDANISFTTPSPRPAVNSTMIATHMFIAHN
ncbi:hypothetical protein DXG01_004386 [Tephrocybe rancida]|nr:hypothetical protein DXG01_004386 [Tephrocybe rancida]